MYIIKVKRDETITQIINECSKLAQNEYKTILGCISMVIHWELGKKFKFNHMNKWYIHNQESVRENQMHKLL